LAVVVIWDGRERAARRREAELLAYYLRVT
jgi:hypothetical protein